jgi:glutathionyl-hydroquinone reductase
VSAQGRAGPTGPIDHVMARELSGGDFKRQDSHFREWIGVNPSTGEAGALPVEAGRYHLYVSLACPWCHRTAILRELAGLGEALPISYVAPFRDERGWAFTGERFKDGPGGRYVDSLHGWKLMSEAYLQSDPSYDARVTVPVLWDTRSQRIVNNESSDIIRMLASGDSLGGLSPKGKGGSGAKLDLYPPALRGEIDEVNLRVYDTINNGVYNAGFARRQGSYERAFAKLFESLQWLEGILGDRRYLLGGRITEADWRLFPTLVRFDEVYHVHFRCNYRRIVEYPNLWGYARELYQWPGVAQTVAMDQIKRHYYTTHDELNPKHIIPVGPAPDWTEPHGRG